MRESLRVPFERRREVAGAIRHRPETFARAAWLRGEKDLLTLTVALVDQSGRIQYDGKAVDPKHLGLTIFEVDTHHRGKHCPEGSLIIFNDVADELFSSNEFPASFSYLDFAPEMKRHFGCLEVRRERRVS